MTCQASAHTGTAPKRERHLAPCVLGACSATRAPPSPEDARGFSCLSHLGTLKAPDWERETQLPIWKDPPSPEQQMNRIRMGAQRWVDKVRAVVGRGLGMAQDGSPVP